MNIIKLEKENNGILEVEQLTECWSSKTAGIMDIENDYQETH
mgnify:CR=1 FL=1